MTGAVAALTLGLLLGDVTAAQPLARGTVIEAGMVVASDEADLLGVLGQQLVRPVFKGRPITAADVRAPDLVARQDAVTIRFRRGGLTLDLPGRALRAGGAGATVPVLAAGRRRPVQATVTAPGFVEVLR